MVHLEMDFTANAVEDLLAIVLLLLLILLVAPFLDGRLRKDGLTGGHLLGGGLR